MIKYTCDICWRSSNRRSDFYTYGDKTICHMCHKYDNSAMAKISKLIDEETVKEIDRMHILDAIKVRLEDAITYLIPVALTPEEAKLVLIEMGATIKDVV